MASGSDRKASPRIGPPTPIPPAALLADLSAALSRGLPAAAATLIQPLRRALTAPPSADPAALAALALAFDQLEDALEVVLFPPAPPPPG